MDEYVARRSRRRLAGFSWTKAFVVPLVMLLIGMGIALLAQAWELDGDADPNEGAEAVDVRSGTSTGPVDAGTATTPSGVSASATPPQTSIEYLANLCATAPETPNPVKIAKITSRIEISQQTGEISVPCDLVLEAGASLSLVDVQLRTKSLKIYAGKSVLGSNVLIEDSRLTGDQTSYLFVAVLGDGGSVAVRRSTLDYPSAVFVGATGHPGTLELSETTMRSQGADTTGINASATEARFYQIRLETSARDEPLLFAEKCTGGEIIGATPRCKSTG